MKGIHIILGVLAVALTACGPRSEGSGSRTVIQNKGSDTLVNVAQAWAENYKDVDANVAVAVTGGGSGTGISAMINGTVDIANTSRQMKQRELDSARANGVEPVKHVVGYDALAVYLHIGNPIDVARRRFGRPDVPVERFPRATVLLGTVLVRPPYEVVVLENTNGGVRPIPANIPDRQRENGHVRNPGTEPDNLPFAKRVGNTGGLSFSDFIGAELTP